MLQKQEGYAWYRQAAELAIFLTLHVILTAAVLYAGGAAYSLGQGRGLEEAAGIARLAMYGVTTASMYSVPWSVITFGPGVTMIPALTIASRITNTGKPGQWVSIKWRWRWKTFASYFGLTAALYILPVCMYAILQKGGGRAEIQPYGALLTVLMCPVQCIAEELIFRGFFMQTFSAWASLPAYGILAQAFYFAVSHPVGAKDIAVIFLISVIWGLLCDATGGIEAACAVHIAFNTSRFIRNMYGMHTGSGSGANAYITCAVISAMCLTIACVRRQKIAPNIRVRR